MAAQLEPLPDAELISAAQAGDADAFTALYDRYVGRVYRLISYRLGRSADAEDLTQQTFVNAWQAIGRYQPGTAPFVAWLLRIAHNASISQLRATHFSVQLNESIDPADDGDVADDLLSQERRQNVLRALKKLEGEQAQAVWMRYMEDLSYPEIAGLLGKSVENVRVITHRGLRKLRRYLEA